MVSQIEPIENVAKGCEPKRRGSPKPDDGGSYRSLSGRQSASVHSIPRENSEVEDDASEPTSCTRLFIFFALVTVVSVPFWTFGWWAADVEILPGLPVSALMVVVPVTVSSALVYFGEEGGLSGLASFLQRSYDFRRTKNRWWWVPTILLMPAVFLSTYGISLASDRPLPEIIVINWNKVPILFLIFFASALAEELGWSGYALDPLQRRLGALAASVLLGVYWSAWHYIPLAQVGRSVQWIAWWTVYAVSSRSLYTWIYNRTCRSVAAVSVFHAMANVSWQVYPNSGSHFDPMIAGLVTTAAALLAVLVFGLNVEDFN